MSTQEKVDQITKDFLAHKEETQRRWDELTKVQNFSWEKYQKICADAERVPGLIDDNTRLATALSLANNRVAHLEGVVSQVHDQVLEVKQAHEANEATRAKELAALNQRVADLDKTRDEERAAAQKVLLEANSRIEDLTAALGEAEAAAKGVAKKG